MWNPDLLQAAQNQNNHCYWNYRGVMGIAVILKAVMHSSGHVFAPSLFALLSVRLFHFCLGSGTFSPHADWKSWNTQKLHGHRSARIVCVQFENIFSRRKSDLACRQNLLIWHCNTLRNCGFKGKGKQCALNKSTQQKHQHCKQHPDCHSKEVNSRMIEYVKKNNPFSNTFWRTVR